MSWFRKLFGRGGKHDSESIPKNKPTSSASKAHAKVAYKSVSVSEARAKADELGILAPGAIAAALHLEQRPESTIYVQGVITCVCDKSLPLEVRMDPGWSGGAPTVTCPDCGTRIAIMEHVSDTTALITASIEAVKRQYQSSKITLILTGFTEKQEEE
jgi:DNA-directed RNA polymerase subunit RPC12/RpoP